MSDIERIAMWAAHAMQGMLADEDVAMNEGRFNADKQLARRAFEIARAMEAEYEKMVMEPFE